LIVYGSPARYLQGRGVLERAGEELAHLGKTALLVVDPVVRSSIGAAIEQSCLAASMTIVVKDFGGECSPAEVDRLAREAGPFRPTVIVAAGGGKCLDTGKALAKRLGARMATVPTIASNDSPTSHIFVLYDADHRLLEVQKLDRNPDLVLVDLDVIANAPARLLLAGIGDAFVKRFEVEQCVKVQGVNVFGSSPSMAALAMARSCYDVLRADAVAALAAVEARRADESLARVVEVCVLMSGLSFESGGLSIAHAMTRGLSAVKPLAYALHGYQVAYAVTVQLVLERRDAAFMADHAAFYREIGLPLSLADLGLPRPSADQLATIADLTLAAPHMKNFERHVSRDELIGAMRTLETQHGKT
jgi:glycerol dehydrogenase